MTTRSILVTVELRGDTGISDRQAIEEINEALAACGRHPLQVRQATTYQVTKSFDPNVKAETLCLDYPSTAVTCRCHLPKGHGGQHHGVDMHGIDHRWERLAAPVREWTPPEDNSRLPVGRKPRRKT